MIVYILPGAVRPRYLGDDDTYVAIECRVRCAPDAVGQKQEGFFRFELKIVKVWQKKKLWDPVCAKFQGSKAQ